MGTGPAHRSSELTEKAVRSTTFGTDITRNVTLDEHGDG
jgi:hypothetical protein